jgi:hypothetical protein
MRIVITIKSFIESRPCKNHVKTLLKYSDNSRASDKLSVPPPTHPTMHRLQMSTHPFSKYLLYPS